MSTTGGNSVDTRVLELKFENGQFEQNAKVSMSTLDRLKKSLDFSKTKKGFQDIQNGIKNVDFSPMSQNVTLVNDRMTILDKTVANIKQRIAGVLSDVAIGLPKTLSHIAGTITGLEQAKGVLDAIGKSAMEVMESGIGMEAMSAGWSKYADKTGAVQTIMAATAKDWNDTGAQMEYVNSQLEKLNWFTDETSYNFLDMVNNIGKFTSNNVALDKSVTAMEGISTWAAISGAGIQGAGHAMYNLAQAISVGSVQLMDWKSIQLANMATTEFKQTAIDTAVELGTLTKAGEGLYKTMQGHEVSVSNFNEALKDDWFSSEVLLSTLEKYGSFTDKLSNSLDQLGAEISASTMLGYIEDFKEGSIDWAEAAATTGTSAEQLKPILAELASEEYAFGMKAFKAAQEAKTFGEAVDSVKDAAGTGWMNTYEIMFGDYLQAKELWTSLAEGLYTIFVEGGNARNALLREAFDTQETINEEDWARLTDAGLGGPGFIKAVRAAASEHEDSVSRMLRGNEWLTYALNNNIITAEALNKALSGTSENVDEGILKLVTDAKESDEAFKGLLETLDGFSADEVNDIKFGDHMYNGNVELEKSLDRVMNKLGLTQESGEALVTVLKSLGYFGGLSAGAFAEMSDEQLKANGYTEAEIKNYRDAVKEGRDYKSVIDEINQSHMSTKDKWYASLQNAIKGVVGLIGTVSEAWNDIFPPLGANVIVDAVDKIYNASEAFKTFATENEDLKTVLHGVFAAFDIVRMVISGVAQAGWALLKGVLSGLGIGLGDLAVRISGVVIAVRDWLKDNDVLANTLTFVTNVATILGQVLRTLLTVFTKDSVIKKFTTRAGSAFRVFSKGFGGYMKNVLGSFDKFHEQVKGLGGIKLSNVGDVFKIFAQTVGNALSNIPGFNILKAAFTDLWRGIKERLKGMGVDVDAVGKIFNTFVETALKIPSAVFNGLMTAGNALGKIFSWFTNIPEVKTLGGALKEGFGFFASNFGTYISGIGDGIAEFKERFKELDGVGIDKIGEGISLFFDTIWESVKNVPGFDIIKQAFDDLVASVKEKLKEFGIDIDGVKEIMQGLVDNVKEKLNAVGELFGSFNPFGIFGEKVEADSKDGTNKTKKSVEKLSETLSKAYEELTKTTDENGEKASTNVVGMAERIKNAFDVLTNGSSALKPLFDIVLGIIRVAILWKSVKTIVTLVRDISGTIKMLGKVFGDYVKTQTEMEKAKVKSEKAKGFRDIALGVVAIAGAVFIIAKVMQELEKLDTEQFPYTLGKLAVAVGALLGLSFALSKMKGLAGAGAGILAATIALYLMLGFIELLKHFELPKDDKEWQDLLTKLGLIIGALALTMLATRALGKNTAGAAAAILATSVALFLMVGVVALLSLIPVEKTDHIITLLIAIVGSLAVLLLVLSGIKTGKAALTVFALGVLLAALAGALLVLSFIPSDKLWSIVGALAVIMLVMALVTGVASAVGFNAVPGLLVGLAALAAVGLILALMAHFTDVDKVATIADSLMKVMLSLAALMFVVGLISLAGPMLASGLIALGAVVGVFIILAGIFAAIQHFTGGGFGEALLAGIDLLIAIGDGIGQFFGSLIAGFHEQTKEAIPEIADTLVSFMEKMQEINAGGSVDFGPLYDMLGAVIAISFSELLTALPNAVTQWVTGKTALAQFSEDVVYMVDALTLWADNMDAMAGITVPSDEIGQLANSINKIAWTGLGTSIAQMIDNFLPGEDKSLITKFSEDVGTLAEALVLWQIKMSIIGGVTVPSDEIGKLSETIGKLGLDGLIQNLVEFANKIFTGKDSLTTFGERTDILADALVNWQTKMDSIGKVTVPTQQITDLSKALDDLPKTGLFEAIGRYLGVASKAEEFKENVGFLGDGLNAFSTNLGENFDETKIGAVVPMITALAESSEQIAALGGGDTWMLPNLSHNLDTLAGHLTKFGDDLVVENEKFKAVEGVSTSFNTLMGAINAAKLTEANGSATDPAAVAAFVTNIDNLIAAFARLSTELDTTGADKLSEATGKLAATDLNAAMASLASESKDAGASAGAESASAMAEGVQSGEKAVKDSVGNVASASASAVDSSKDSYGSKGSDMVVWMAAGVSGAGALLTAAVATVVSQATEGVVDTNAWMGIGENLASGIAAGIRARTYEAINATVALMVQSMQAARNTAVIQSPSKKMYEIGTYFVRGFANAVGDNTAMAARETGNMAGASLKAMRLAVRGIGDIFGSDIDGQPVIRPVLDLSDIESGARSISGMFGNMAPIPLAGNIDAIAANSLSLRQAATTDDILTALGDMSPSGDTYNYNVNGVTYDDGSNITDAVRTLVRAVRVRGRA